MEDLVQSFLQLVFDLGRFSTLLLQLVLNSALLIAWIAWWLFGVNWHKAWPVLRQGAWVPALLVVVAASLVWSQISPSEIDLPGTLVVPNFWWQLGATSLIALLTLFCGWLQGVFGWAPPDINLDPAPSSAGHGHDGH